MVGRVLPCLLLLEALALSSLGIGTSAGKLRRDACDLEQGDADCIDGFSNFSYNATFDDLQAGIAIPHTYTGLDFNGFHTAKPQEADLIVEPHSPDMYIEAMNATSPNSSSLPAMTASQGASIFKLKTFYWACGFDADEKGNCTLEVGGYDPGQAENNPLELVGGPVTFVYAGSVDLKCQRAELDLGIMPDNFIYNTLIFNLTSCGEESQVCSLFLDSLEFVTYSLDEFRDD